MTPETAVLLSAVIPSTVGLFTWYMVRRDANKKRAKDRDAKVLRAEEGAYGRATESDISLIKRLQARVEAAEARAEEAWARAEEMERKNVRLTTRVYKLEMAMAAAGLEIPA